MNQTNKTKCGPVLCVVMYVLTDFEVRVHVEFAVVISVPKGHQGIDTDSDVGQNLLDLSLKTLHDVFWTQEVP